MLRAGSIDRFIASELLTGMDTRVGSAQVPKRGLLALPKGLAELCRNAGVEESFVHKICVATSLVSALSAPFGGPLPTCIFLCMGVLLTGIKLNRLVAKRRAALDSDLPALLTSLSASVRAGIEPLSAISKAKSFFPQQSLLCFEIQRFERQLVGGASEEEAILQFCSSIDHPDLPLFRSCVLLSRRHGSALAEPLHRVVRVTRQRQSFRRKTRAALAMHRMSAIGITLCAVLISAVQVAMNWRGVSETLQHPMGMKLMAVGAALIVLGSWWMMSMGKATEG